MKSPVVLYRSLRALALPLLAMGGVLSARADNPDLNFSGMGWAQYGQVVQSTDTGQARHYSGNSIQSTGAQLLLRVKVSENLEGAAGLGVLENHFMSDRGTVGRIQLIENPYIAEASFTYSFWKTGNSQLKIRGGLFPYDYNPDVKNLGLYLLRGPVHPGILLSGFETKAVLPIANTLGFQLHHEWGGFSQDFILNSETDLYPYYDISPAYVANYRATPAFRFGAGVNFYRYLAVEPKLTSPNYLSPAEREINPADKSPYARNYIYVDSATKDTTFISFAGIKLMANASFDPKSMFGGLAMLGPEDLKIYGEIALLGLENDKAYREIYGDYLHRMPVMVGFNIPTLRGLDNLSLEVEWYGAKFKDDLSRYQTGPAYYPSPLPVSNVDPVASIFDVEGNLKRDNWKWSLYGARTIQHHFKISFQVANDHFRPGGIVNGPSQEAVFSTLEDWYWMTKIAYFF